MKVLLVRAPGNSPVRECLPPANLGYLAGFYKSGGHEVNAVDFRIETGSLPESDLLVLESKKPRKLSENQIRISPKKTVREALKKAGGPKKIPFPDWTKFRIEKYRELFTGRYISELPVYIGDRPLNNISREIERNRKTFGSGSQVLLGPAGPDKLGSVCKIMNTPWKYRTDSLPSESLFRPLIQSGCTHLIIDTDRLLNVPEIKLLVDLNIILKKDTSFLSLVKFALKSQADYLSLRGSKRAVISGLLFYLRPVRFIRAIKVINYFSVLKSLKK